eukprot:TRINITY_DN855_c0_g1_i1.p1 TRINITY_DN855_c0_g1~~TRINITY_DN855_c0_g1_i1.p1  ORF type:complete len:110 (-),score=11.56 TRINITY_DN855_c0_g1_i1:263-592(-)
MTPVQTTALCRALERSNIIRTIDLSGVFRNVAKHAAGAAVARLIESNNTMTHLNINKNNLGDDGIQEIALALKQNSTLQSLSLTHNLIGDLGAESLADAIPKKSVSHNT